MIVKMFWLHYISGSYFIGWATNMDTEPVQKIRFTIPMIQHVDDENLSLIGDRLLSHAPFHPKDD